MRDFRGLEVWQLAHQLTLAIYRTTKRFPREELFGLTSQMRRCSASIAANLAEGCGRSGDGEFHRFVQMASGSASELDYHLILAHDLSLIDGSTYAELGERINKLRRKLTSLLLKVEGDRAQREPALVRAHSLSDRHVSRMANGEARMAGNRH